MKKGFQLFVCLLLVSGMLTLSGCVDDAPDIPDVTQSGLQDDVLYQVSTIDALLEDVGGSIVGFWLPYYVEDLNVPGYHFHFIENDRKKVVMRLSM